MAIRWLREAAEHLRSSDPRMALPPALAMLARALAQRGEADGAEEALRAAHDALTRIALRHWGPEVELARAELWLAAARGQLTRAQAIGLDYANEHPEMVLHGATLLHDSLRVGAPARRVLPELGARAERVDAEIVAVYSDHAKALATLDGDALGVVSARFEGIGALLLAAEATAGAAHAFRAAGRADSARRADEAGSALAARCGGPRTPPLAAPGDPSELTSREREVALLAARGLSSPEIAGRLELSPRTVETYLQRAYLKLGVHRRDQLAGAL